MTEKIGEYVLGTGDDELVRLGLQHRLWADATTSAWKRAGVGPGSRVLDLGCGPGYATFDLAQLVTRSGQIVAMDASLPFLNFLKTQAKVQGHEQIQTRVGDAQNLTSALSTGEKFDVIYCRWVICWLKNPELALKGMFEALKPGGRVIIHDYFNWKTMAIAPRSAAVEKMVKAAIESFDEQGGDIDIGGRLLGMLSNTGFSVTHFDVHQRVARGGGKDSTIAWPVSWWRTYGPKLVKLNKLTAEEMSLVNKELDDLEVNPNRFFFCPPLLEFIAHRAE